MLIQHSGSSSSDNEEDPSRGLVLSRHRKLQQRSQRRIRKYLGMALEKQHGASLLEVLSAAPTTVSRFREDLERFLQWADDKRHELPEGDAVDSALVEFLNLTNASLCLLACCLQPKPSTFDGAMCKLLMYPCQRVTKKFRASSTAAKWQVMHLNNVCFCNVLKLVRWSAQ